jgi:hypothetical protein
MNLRCCADVADVFGGNLAPSLAMNGRYSYANVVVLVDSCFLIDPASFPPFLVYRSRGALELIVLEIDRLADVLVARAHTVILAL